MEDNQTEGQTEGQTETNNKYSIALFLFGVVFIGVLIIVSIKYPSTIQEYFTIYKSILAISCAGIASLLPGFFNLRYKSLISTGGALGVFVFIFLFLEPNENTFTIRAIVQSDNDANIDKSGKVMMLLGNEVREASINKNNDVLFENIPIKYLAIPVKFSVDFAEKLRLSKPDSMYSLVNEKIIYLNCHLALNNIVKGTVVFNDNPLDSVKVTIDRFAATTNNLGYYRIELDTVKLDNEQIVNFYKPGFKFKRNRIFLQSLKDLDVVMEK